MRSNLMTLPYLHRSGRTSLVRLQIRDYRLVVLSMIEICTLFVCYACIGYFSQFAQAFTHIACLSESLSMYRWFYGFFDFSLLLLSVLPLIRSNLTVDGNRLDSERLQVHLYQTIDSFVCYILSRQIHWLNALHW